MSKYYVDKFLFTVDRDPALLRRYKEDSEIARSLLGAVDWAEAQ